MTDKLTEAALRNEPVVTTKTHYCWHGAHTLCQDWDALRMAAPELSTCECECHVEGGSVTASNQETSEGRTE